LEQEERLKNIRDVMEKEKKEKDNGSKKEDIDVMTASREQNVTMKADDEKQLTDKKVGVTKKPPVKKAAPKLIPIENDTINGLQV
jgi:hypothetical protein